MTAYVLGKIFAKFGYNTGSLYSLLKKDTEWFWNSQHEEAFMCSKELLTSETLLVHYDLTKELVLSCDASQYGLGAVLLQVYGKLERPVAYASRSLSSAEKIYSQLEKEGLAIVFGIKSSSLVGGSHYVCADHKPFKVY